MKGADTCSHVCAYRVSMYMTQDYVSMTQVASNDVCMAQDYVCITQDYVYMYDTGDMYI